MNVQIYDEVRTGAEVCTEETAFGTTGVTEGAGTDPNAMRCEVGRVTETDQWCPTHYMIVFIAIGHD